MQIYMIFFLLLEGHYFLDIQYKQVGVIQSKQLSKGIKQVFIKSMLRNLGSDPV